MSVPVANQGIVNCNEPISEHKVVVKRATVAQDRNQVLSALVGSGSDVLISPPLRRSAYNQFWLQDHALGFWLHLGAQDSERNARRFLSNSPAMLIDG